ncbi:synaptotagmin A [Actinidia rufa]|uniref:Synaptotagmin A n=1 Tax=Actinidia rufa TaxID=165716 RepID=A0A7J0DN00_9ERIC|nr:synaptotagmin A [Actinidia rufa]
MGFVSTVMGCTGFGAGVSVGLVVGYFLFIYFLPSDVKDPIIRPLIEQDTATLQRLLPEIPLWVKNPDYDRIDWLNKFIEYMWPYLDKAICKTAISIAKPIIAEQIPKYKIESVEFETFTLGSLPPTFHGMKVYVTDEKELIMEPSLKWAGNPNVILAVKAFGLKASIQVVDLQIFASPRITLKPLVPSFPCFANIYVSLMEKPHVDFGLKLLGADLMSIPGLYRAMQKPVGILHVKVLRAMKLKKKDLLGASDPYVKLKLTEDKLPSKKTTVKRRNLNPEWNEEFNLAVKDPETQALEFHVYDWEQVGKHDKMGMNVVPLNELPLMSQKFGGMLVVIVHEAQDVEGKHHTNPYVRILFRGEEKKTKHVKKNRDPRWEEEFHFMLDEPPTNDKMHVEVQSASSKIGLLHPKECLGYVDINLSDVVSNKRINEKYHLIDSKNGRIQIELQWRTSS